MLRKHENSVSWKAGVLAIGVHVVLLVAMLVSFNWKSAHTVLNVTEVELWDKLPAPQVVETPKPEPKPLIEEKPEPKPESVIEEKPEPKPEEPKVDIELEKKKKELEQIEAEDKLKKEKELDQKKKLAALQAESREDELKDKKAADKQNKDALKKLQQEALSDKKAQDDKLASAANAGVIGEFKTKIRIKIQGNVNKTLCGDGNPELLFEIKLLPTGELSGIPRLVKSNANEACNDAVERAITTSQPLPLPDDKSLFSAFREINITFRPND